MRQRLASASTMSLCGVTRLLMPAFVVGLAASTLTGSDLLGMILAALTFVVLAVVQRVTGTATACAIPPSDHARPGSSSDLESTHAER